MIEWLAAILLIALMTVLAALCTATDARLEV